MITLADEIAGTYLELISVDSNISSEMNNMYLALCTLSTRALQRLRNEVHFCDLCSMTDNPYAQLAHYLVLLF